MSTTLLKQQVDLLREEFCEYLHTNHPDWSESTLSTRMSDAFFCFNNNVGIDFWSSLTNAETMLAARDKIRDHFASEKQYGKPDSRADYYHASLQLLKDFIDAKHPGLAQDWSNKTVSDLDLRSDFKVWMQKTKKSDGSHYSLNTISTYLTALKTSTGKLILAEPLVANLFTYSDLGDFQAARELILAAPNLAEIDKSAGNGAYTAALALYERFLKEHGTPAAWIFQGNPKYYDVAGAVANLDVITWAVNQYPKQIKRGDRAYIWVSGSEGGIIAKGTILCDPELRAPNVDDIYNCGESLKDQPYLAVDIELTHKLKSTILRSILLADERTKKLEILTYPGATNFRVTSAQEAVIESAISGNYKRVEIVDSANDDMFEKRRYWLYAPGPGASQWETFLSAGIMGIGWDELGDLTSYSSKEKIKSAMREISGTDQSYMNDGHALWQFVNEIKSGDIVYAKRGRSAIIGRGIVQSEYQFDDSRKEYKHIHKVKWLQTGEWEHPGQAGIKTLTDVTLYTDYVQTLEMLFANETNYRGENEPEVGYPDYTQDDFLNDVFMAKERYNTLKSLLLRKKNVILQGAPGVGKTFSAQRLAYSIMGVKDDSRVKVVQFHQSYSYEDFIMGFRPDGVGFKLSTGPFYEFCKQAEEDNERPYFFIIDEINRGNLSKIFGELLMLIESDKRDRKNAIRLLYADEQFYVPKNIHIIGMMNTADRSLAIIDYALRRRFAFFNMEPAFSTDGFKQRQNAIQNSKFDGLIATIELLNKEIAQDISLGIGFRIGHSYFCTNDVVDDDWLSAVVEYELLPLLEEYWFDEPSKVESWVQRLRGAVHG